MSATSTPMTPIVRPTRPKGHTCLSCGMVSYYFEGEEKVCMAGIRCDAAREAAKKVKLQEEKINQDANIAKRRAYLDKYYEGLGLSYDSPDPVLDDSPVPVFEDLPPPPAKRVCSSHTNIRGL